MNTIDFLEQYWLGISLLFAAFSLMIFGCCGCLGREDEIDHDHTD